jgi:hypothetical protein
MRIAFIYTKGRIARLAEVREGKAASEFIYGEFIYRTEVIK